VSDRGGRCLCWRSSAAAAAAAAELAADGESDDDDAVGEGSWCWSRGGWEMLRGWRTVTSGDSWTCASPDCQLTRHDDALDNVHSVLYISKPHEKAVVELLARKKTTIYTVF